MDQVVRFKTTTLKNKIEICNKPISQTDYFLNNPRKVQFSNTVLRFLLEVDRLRVK